MEEKQLLIRPNEKSPMLFEVYYEMGGELPDVLKGHLFTHKSVAQSAIDTYLNQKKVKKVGTKGNKS